MTARFAHRRIEAPTKAPAAAKPTRSPATPAAALPKGDMPPPRDAFKEVCVFNAGGVGRTTILIPWGEFEHMLSFAGESDVAVEHACRTASKALAAENDRTWSEIVASGAMLELMCAFASRRRVKPRRQSKK